MISGFSDYFAALVLDEMLVGKTFYLGTLTDSNTQSQRDAGTVTEPSSGDYARVGVVLQRSGRQLSNAATINLPVASGGWGLQRGAYLFDAAVGGNPVVHTELLGSGKTFTVDPATDTFASTAHGLSNGARVQVRNVGGALPGGLDAVTSYFVVNATADTFQLSLAEGGPAVDVTSAGSGLNQVHLDYMKEIEVNDMLTFGPGELVFELIGSSR